MKKQISSIVLLFSLLLFSSCATNSTPSTPSTAKKEVPKSNFCTSLKENLQENVVTEFISEKVEVIKSVFITPAIEGQYNLVKGEYFYRDNNLFVQNQIEASSIVIEKLSENDFGFYYVTKLKDHEAQGYFGGFTYKDRKFYQKLIDYPTTNTTLRDNISLTKDGDRLTLKVNTVNGKRNITWEKSDKPIPTVISDALDRERKDYLQLYKDKLYPSSSLAHEVLAFN